MMRHSNISELEYLSASQWGMFTTTQAQTLGLRRNQIFRLVDSMRAERLCCGVYRFVAGCETPYSDLKAAWLSLFPKKTATERLSIKPHDAVVAAESAAALLKAGDFHLCPYTFITSKRRQISRSEIRILGCKLDQRDVMFVDDLPTTTPERTVFDLLGLNVDPSLIDGFMRDIAQTYFFNINRLGELLDPIAPRHGFPQGGTFFATDLLSRNVEPIKTEKLKELESYLLKISTSSEALF